MSSRQDKKVEDATNRLEHLVDRIEQNNILEDITLLAEDIKKKLSVLHKLSKSILETSLPGLKSNYRTIIKLGNSLAMTFPQKYIDELRLKPKDKIIFIQFNGLISCFPIKNPRVDNKQTYQNNSPP